MPKMQDTKTLTTPDGDTLELTVNKLEPVDAYVLTAKLGKVLIPAFVAARSGKSAELHGVVDTMFDKLGPELATQIMYDLFRGCLVIRNTPEGAAQKFDLAGGKAAVNNAFRGNLKGMFVALGFALEVNFGDFFGEGGLAALVTRTPSPSSSTTK